MIQLNETPAYTRWWTQSVISFMGLLENQQMNFFVYSSWYLDRRNYKVAVLGSPEGDRIEVLMSYGHNKSFLPLSTTEWPQARRDIMFYINGCP